LTKDNEISGALYIHYEVYGPADLCLLLSRESFAFVVEHFIITIITIKASATTIRIGNTISKIDSWRYALEFSLCCSIIAQILHKICGLASAKTINPLFAAR
jgi:hypothetical protein